jgi:putative component of membrane protein insertase Oxa1/YidC/SpoIIIJ protein YidD
LGPATCLFIKTASSYRLKIVRQLPAPRCLWLSLQHSQPWPYHTASGSRT